MKLKRLISSVLIIALVAGVFLGLVLLFLYHHPSTAKMLIENSLSERLGTRVFIGELEYGVDPLRMHAAEISARDDDGGSGLAFRLKSLDAALKLEGPFGQRTLVIERLALAGVSMQAGNRVDWAKIMPDSGPPSVLSRLATRATAVLLFRDLRIGAVDLTESELEWRTDDLKLMLRGVRAGSTPEGIQLDGTAQVIWPEKDAALEVPVFSVRVNPELSMDRGVLSAHLHLPDARYAGPRTAADITRFEARLELAWGADRFDIKTGQVECRDLTFRGAGTHEIAVHAPRLSVAGDFNRNERVLKLASWQLVVENLVDVRGEAELRLDPSHSIRLTLNDGVLFPDKMIAPVLLAAGFENAPLSVTGPVGISGSLGLSATGQGWVEEVRLTAVFKENAVKTLRGPLQAEGIVSGSVQASGRAAEPTLAVQLNGRDFMLARSGFAAKSLSFDLSAGGTYPAFTIPLLAARVPTVQFSIAEGMGALKDLVLQIKNGKLDAETAAVSFPEIMLSSKELRNLSASVAGDSRQLVVEAGGSDMGLVDAAAKFGFLPAAWRFTGADRLQAKAVVRPKGDSSLSTTIELSRMGFADAGGRCVGEGITLRAEINSRFPGKDQSFTATAALTSSGGELLYDRIYLDLSKHPAAFSTELRYAAADRKLEIKDATLEIEKLMTWVARGHWVSNGRQAAYDLTLKMPAVPIAPLFENFIAEPLRYRQPFLAGIQVDGRFSAELGLSGGGDRIAFRGLAEWQSGNITTPDGAIRLEGIDLRLPLWHQGGGSDGPPMAGALSVRKIALPNLPAQDLKLPFTVGPDQLNTTGDLRVRFPSGEVRIGAVACRDLFSARPKIQTDVTVDRVQAGHFLKGLWSAPVDAVVNGRLQEVTFDGLSVRSRGRLITEIFGGKLMVDNLGVSGVLSAAPNLNMDCSIHALDLAQLTEETSFGRIRGLLSGYVNDLEIVNGQPQKFTLQLETIRRQGIPQRINVEAVESIARIGGGQSPFVGLAGNFAGFFKEFTYDKIGVRAVLENDLFRINGTIQDNGVEYLVKKGGIPGVDVLNLNPVNQISFRDMVKRIRRVTESESGPVVN